VKVIISYPPIDTEKGYPTLGQNRQFQFFREPTYIYPVVPASAATLLKKAGHQVIWNDCIALGWDYPRFLEFVKAEEPGLIAIETKTPAVKQHWKIINDIKELFTRMADPKETGGTAPQVVLYGDHVTALPEESFLNSKVDFVLTGGDYDFLLLNLCNFLSRKETRGIVPEDTELEPGIYYRDNGRIRSSGQFQLNHDLDSLPFIDRELTDWRLYAFQNGNYKRTPGTYIMSARDCWWGKCTFCSWPQIYPRFRSRKAVNVLDEIGSLIENQGVREIMDDSGSFPVGQWINDFCEGMIARGYNKRIFLDCNMRFGALSFGELNLMKRAGFRLLLFGLESANQATLDRLKKNIKVEDIVEGCRQASKAGLYPHITIMFGYPWETYEDALKTLRLGGWLLRKGYAYTMQATMVIPYPGTPLFEECKRENLLNTLNWEDYDMKSPVMKTNVEASKITGLVQGMYRVSFQPEFILRKLLSLRDMDDIKYYFRALKKVGGHIFDFRGLK